MTSEPLTFAELPTELRWDIWDMALLSEAENRIVLLSDVNEDDEPFTVLASKHLVSPLLLANAESRRRALRFYSSTLEVHDIYPSPGDDNSSHASVIHLSTRHDTFLVENNDFYTYNHGKWRSDIEYPSTRERDFKVEDVRKICFIVDHDTGSMTYRLAPWRPKRWWQLGNSFEDDAESDSPELEEPWESLSWFALFVPRDAIPSVCSLIQKKGRAGLDAYLQLFDHECSYARICNQNSINHRALASSGGFPACRYDELITPAQFATEMNSRGRTAVWNGRD